MSLHVSSGHLWLVVYSDFPGIHRFAKQKLWIISSKNQVHSSWGGERVHVPWSELPPIETILQAHIGGNGFTGDHGSIFRDGHHGFPGR